MRRNVVIAIFLVVIAIGIVYYEFFYKKSGTALSAAVGGTAWDADDETASQRILSIVSGLPGGSDALTWFIPLVDQSNAAVADYYRIDGKLPKSGAILAGLDAAVWADGDVLHDAGAGIPPPQTGFFVGAKSTAPNIVPSPHDQAHAIWQTYKANYYKKELLS